MKWRKPKLSIFIIIRNDPEQIPRELHSDITHSHHRSGTFHRMLPFLALRIHAFVALLKRPLKLMGSFPGLELQDWTLLRMLSMCLKSQINNLIESLTFCLIVG